MLRTSHGHLAPEAHPPSTAPAAPGDGNEFLSSLRREFPRWGIMHGTTRAPWVAVRSLKLGRMEITAEDGITLREKLLIATEQDRETP